MSEVPLYPCISQAALAEATAQNDATDTQGRRDKATLLDAWLRDCCGIDEEEERTEVLDAFLDPRYSFRCGIC